MKIPNILSLLQEIRAAKIDGDEVLDQKQN